MIVKLNIKKGPAGYVKRPSQLLYLDYAYFERDFLLPTVYYDQHQGCSYVGGTKIG